MTLADRIHPNARAIGLVVSQVAPAVTAALRSALRAAA
jgi:hypothetical protein